MWKLRFFRYSHSSVDARKVKQQLQQNDITYEVRRSVVASKQETSANFHSCQVRQTTYDFVYVFVIWPLTVLIGNVSDFGMVTTQHISYIYMCVCGRIFILRRLQDHSEICTFIMVYASFPF